MEKLIISLLLLNVSFRLFPQEQIKFETLDNRYALIIGISNYQDNSINLNYAAKDADDIYNVITTKGRFKKDNVKLLTDSLASRENIRKNIEGWLQKYVTASDLVFIYFSGHGSQGEDYNNDEEDGFDEYLVPFDFDLNDISTGISDDNFAYWVKNLSSENIIIVFDCCYSGGAAKYKGFTPPNLKSVSITTTNDFSDEIPKEGTCLLSASRGDQTSQEDPKLQNGVFTYHLINGINTKNDLNSNNIIDEDELFKYIKSKLDKKKQEPLLLDHLKNNLDLFYLVTESKKVDADYEDLNHKIKYLKDNTRTKRSTSENIQLIEWLEKKLEYNPKDINTNIDLASCYETIEDYKKAYYYYDVLNSIDKSKEWFFKLSELAIKNADCERAKVILETKLESKNKISVLNNLANACLCLGDTLDGSIILKVQ